MSNIREILGELIKGKTMTASDKRYSNSNQYFVAIKKQGVELIEEWRPNKKNRGKHKARRLKNSIENIHKAKNLMQKLA